MIMTRSASVPAETISCDSALAIVCLQWGSGWSLFLRYKLEKRPRSVYFWNNIEITRISRLRDDSKLMTSSIYSRISQFIHTIPTFVSDLEKLFKLKGSALGL